MVQEIEYTSDYGKPKSVPQSQFGHKALTLDQSKNRQSIAGASAQQAANMSQKSASSRQNFQSQMDASNINASGAPMAAGNLNVTQSSAGWNSQMPSGSSQSRRAQSQTQNNKQAALKQELKPKVLGDTAVPAAQRDQQYAKMLSSIKMRGGSSQAGSRSMLQLQKSGTTMRRRRLG